MPNKMITKILKILQNKKGKIEGQRINEKWFLKHDFSEEYEWIKLKNIKNSQDIYNYINNADGLCECGNKKRFVSFNQGYKKYCEKCARTKNNWTKNIKIQEVNPDVDFKFRKELKKLINTCLTQKNKISTSKIMMLPELNKIFASTWYLKNVNINERIYHIMNDLFELPKCKTCNGNLDNFYSFERGYRTDYCKKNNCARTSPDKYVQHEKHLLHFFKKYKDIEIPKDTKMQMFSFDEYKENKENCQYTFTHKCGHTYKRSIYYQGYLHCPKCYPIRSKQQYFIHDWIYKELNIESSFNDRKTLKGKELDLYFENQKLAIEYDGQAYHSYGKSNDNRFNSLVEDKNIHSYKTELCEEKGIQLFRIFSSEWLNPQKKEIWKSMIKSKLKQSERIYARKCSVKEISSKESKEFLEVNHMQGHINGSIRLGLYLDSKLVQIMTFRKPTQNKYKGTDKYELSRMCSLINNSVIGGASKLLKYFERNYNPKLILSYANRRWSEGNVYDKLGFNKSHITEPNYFYIMGNNFDNNKLESRNKFQKHKLKNKLEIFDEKLTETENMYNNNYRKIYDCGNLVYVKEY